MTTGKPRNVARTFMNWRKMLRSASNMTRARSRSAAIMFVSRREIAALRIAVRLGDLDRVGHDRPDRAGEPRIKPTLERHRGDDRDHDGRKGRDEAEEPDDAGVQS